MTNPISSLITYVRSSKAELEKVNWPSRQETIRYSLLVVAVSVAMAGFFAALDFGLGQGVDLALKGRAPSEAAPAEQPAVPDLTPVEATDANGNPVNVKVTPIPINGNDQGGFTVTP